MPTNDYTSPGSYSWTAPFATRNVTATAIGGGGSGFKDKTDNEAGGGGGGAGFARSTRSVAGGSVLSIFVGDGGARPGNQSSNDGGNSSVNGGGLSITAYGGKGGRDGIGGGGQGGAGDTAGTGENGQEDANDGSEGGRGGGAGKPGGNAGGCGGRPNGGQGVTLDGTNGSCTGGRNGGNYGGGGGGNSSGGDAGRGGKGAVRITWDYHPPSITSFTGSTQTSGNGIPSSEVTLSWQTQFADSISVSDGVGGGSAIDSKTFNSGLQSVAGSNSPAQKTYTLTASGPGGSVTANATVYVYNDNTPSNSWTTSFINLEPNTVVTLTLGTLSGVDMPTTISTSGTGNFVGNGGSFGGTRNFNNGETIQLRTTSLPFNTDISGLSANATFGKTNSKTVTVSTPGGSFNVTVTTRAPRIKEDFDYANNINKYPFEDIDLIENSPTEYLTSAQITANDIEIAMEMKADKPDAQISINGGSWQNVRSI